MWQILYSCAFVCGFHAGHDISWHGNDIAKFSCTDHHKILLLLSLLLILCVLALFQMKEKLTKLCKGDGQVIGVISNAGPYIPAILVGFVMHTCIYSI